MMQIDHTPVDAIVVDYLTRKPIARPWLTLAIDVATRVVLGMSVSMESPSIHSVSLALTHACLPKDRWIADRGLDLTWELRGLPKSLKMDNAREFKSEAIRSGCDECGVQKIFRPVARPHFGGHIERLIGTLMGRVHLLPGTTTSSSAERGDYNSAKSATRPLAEFEAWLALEIAGRYHRQICALGISPLAAWEAALKRGLVPSLHVAAVESAAVAVPNWAALAYRTHAALAAGVRASAVEPPGISTSTGQMRLPSEKSYHEGRKVSF